MSHQNDSAGPSGTDFAPPPGPPPGRAEPSPAPASSKPHDTQADSTSAAPNTNTAATGPSPVSTIPPPIHLGPTSNYSEPSPIDLEHPAKRPGALPTPSGLHQVQYGSEQASSKTDSGTPHSLPLRPGASSNSPAAASETDKYSSLPEVATTTPPVNWASRPDRFSDLPEVATATPAPPQSGSGVQTEPQPSGTSQPQPGPSNQPTATPSGQVPPPPPGQPGAAPQSNRNQASAPPGQTPPPGQLATASQPNKSQTSIPLAHIPPPPPNPPSTASRPDQTNTSSGQVVQPPQFPPPPGQPDSASKPSQTETTGQYPPPPQFPPPPGQYETPTKRGFTSLPNKFHIWTSWEKGQSTDGHSVPCIEMGPEPFSPPVYSTKMAESLSFKAGRWSDNGPTVGEVKGKGTFTTQSVLLYNGFQTDFGNTGTTLVDIGSMGVWQFNIPVQGQGREEEAWEWRRVRDPNSTGADEQDQQDGRPRRIAGSRAQRIPGGHHPVRHMDQEPRLQVQEGV
uniref:Uncharacterized protein n=1 Tax=Bionectria ochroleuca TaxID=29856 RepID=A0A8H7NEQ9_BIOOC